MASTSRDETHEPAPAMPLRQQTPRPHALSTAQALLESPLRNARIFPLDFQRQNSDDFSANIVARHDSDRIRRRLAQRSTRQRDISGRQNELLNSQLSRRARSLPDVALEAPAMMTRSEGFVDERHRPSMAQPEGEDMPGRATREASRRLGLLAAITGYFYSPPAAYDFAMRGEYHFSLAQEWQSTYAHRRRRRDATLSAPRNNTTAFISLSQHIASFLEISSRTRYLQAFARRLVRSHARRFPDTISICGRRRLFSDILSPPSARCDTI